MDKEVFIEDIVKQVKSEFEKAQNDRKSLELAWRLNMNFMNGNQFSEINLLGNVEDYGKQYFWQEREVYNQIAPIVETRLAKLGRVQAGVSIRPFSDDDNDVNIAKMSTSILKSIMEQNELNKIISKGCMWSEICGSSFYKIIWDSEKGNLIGQDKNGNKVYDGDICITVCPPYEIYPDNITATSIEECNYILHAKAYSVNEIRNIWGVDIVGESIDVFSMDSSRTTGGLGYASNVTRLTSTKQDNACIVIEKYERPSKEFPNGRHIIIAGENLLHIGELPFKNETNGERGLPFVRQVAIENLTNFYGTSLIERLIPLQRAYNSVKNRKHEFLNRIAMGVLAVEDGSVDIDNLEEEGLSPGKVLVYRQGSNPPKMMDMGNVPNDFSYEESRLEDEFIRISGVSELMRFSQLPQNMTSGIAISLLQEQDDTRISISADSIRNAVKSIGQMILRLYKQFATDKRLIRISGENGGVQLQYFIGSELASDDVVFDTDNALNETPASRRNMVLELIKMGLLQDENGKIDSRTKLKILEMLGFGSWESARDIDECHYLKAIRENLELRINDIQALEIDNHKLHIQEHTKAVVSENSDNEYKQKLINHINEHKMLEDIIGGNNAGDN